MGTIIGRIYGKGAPFKGVPQRFGGGSCSKLPPLDPPLVQTEPKYFKKCNPLTETDFISKSD